MIEPVCSIIRRERKVTGKRQAERVGLVQPGEEKAAGRPDCSLSVLKGSL